MTEEKIQSFSHFTQSPQMENISNSKSQGQTNQNNNNFNQQFKKWSNYSQTGNQNQANQKLLYFGKKNNHNDQSEEGHAYSDNNSTYIIKEQIKNQINNNYKNPSIIQQENTHQNIYGQQYNQAIKPISNSNCNNEFQQPVFDQQNNQSYNDMSIQEYSNQFDQEDYNNSQNVIASQIISNQINKNQKQVETECFFTPQNLQNEVYNYSKDQHFESDQNINNVFPQNDCNQDNNDQKNIQSFQDYQMNEQQFAQMNIDFDDFFNNESFNNPQKYDTQNEFDNILNRQINYCEKPLIKENIFCGKTEIENCSVEPQVFTDSQKLTNFQIGQSEDNLKIQKDDHENNKNFIEYSDQFQSNLAISQQQNQQIECKMNISICQTKEGKSLTQNYQQQKQQQSQGGKSKMLLDETLTISENDQQNKQKQKRKSKYFQFMTEIQLNCEEIDSELLSKFKIDLTKNFIRDMLKKCNKNINQKLLKQYLQKDQMEQSIFNIYQRIDSIYQQIFINHQQLNSEILQQRILTAYVQLYNDNRNRFKQQQVKYLFQSTAKNFVEQQKEIDLVAQEIKNKSNNYIILLIDYSKLIFKEFFNHFTENLLIPYLFNEYKSNKYPSEKYKNLKFKQQSFKIMLQFYEIVFIQSMQNN
ncbi:hypothetical protein ABPG74_002745 [Tetrahymena malaccensis]